MRLLLLAVLALALAPLSFAAPPAPLPPTVAIDPAWSAALDEEDRAEADRRVGWAAAPFTRALHWRRSRGLPAPPAWEGLRDRVVVLQFFTSRSAAGQIAARRTTEALAAAPEALLILVHVPDSTSRLDAFLDALGTAAPVAIDTDGGFCDAYGAYRTPLTVVVDRDGVVAASGLTPEGTAACAAALLARPRDPKRVAAPEPRQGVIEGDGRYPATSGTVGRATDLRGKPAPPLAIGEWIVPGGPIEDRVVVVDFWATWCGPCVKGMPHVAQLAEEIGDAATFVGLSNETRLDFEGGMKRIGLEAASIGYGIALDPSGATMKAVGIRAIPHCLVISRDGIVRWQGHPDGLNVATLRRIVAASGSPGDLGRWQRRPAKK